MNRIEQKMKQLKKQNKKAFITYMTAGLPDMKQCMEIIKAQEEVGTDVIELGIPFSDPVADGPIIQAASYEAICKGVTVKKVFEAAGQLRKSGCEIPIIFMMYYNTILHYGVSGFAKKCSETGIDGLIIPDLPYEEQQELSTELEKEGKTILIQLVSPASKQRLPMLVKNARGFIYCVSSMGVTGQEKTFYNQIRNYLEEVKQVSKIPIMIGFGITQASDVFPVADVIDGAIVGSHFIQLMKDSNYDMDTVKTYCSTFKKELNQENEK